MTLLTPSQAFSKIGHLADDIDYTELFATIDLTAMPKSVTKAESTLAQLKPTSRSPFSKAFQLDGSEALWPAIRRFKTL